MKTSPDVRSAICVADLQVRLSLAVRVVLGVLVQPLRDHEAVQRQESAPDLPGECLQAVVYRDHDVLPGTARQYLVHHELAYSGWWGQRRHVVNRRKEEKDKGMYGGVKITCIILTVGAVRATLTCVFGQRTPVSPHQVQALQLLLVRNRPVLLLYHHCGVLLFLELIADINESHLLWGKLVERMEETPSYALETHQQHGLEDAVYLQLKTLVQLVHLLIGARERATNK